MKKYFITTILNSIILLCGFLLTVVLLDGCIKDKDYEYPQVYDDVLKSLSFTYIPDSLPADGSSKSVITIKVLPDNKTDSINISAIGLNITTSNGTFAENNAQMINIVPTYKLDTISNTKLLIAIVTLVSSTKVGSANLTIKYGGVETAKSINFYYVYPDKMKLSVSSFLVSPNFTNQDTLFAQLSSMSGLPSQGTPLSLKVFDSSYVHEMGIFKTAPTKTNAQGNGSFIFVLGDSVVNNNVNYQGTLHVIGYTVGSVGHLSDTINIFSRK
jgi:hypothetical protein